jgi:hypothetical protein
MELSRIVGRFPGLCGLSRRFHDEKTTSETEPKFCVQHENTGNPLNAK